MPTFRLRVCTPDGVFIDKDIYKLIVRTTVGDVGIMYDHINYVGTLRIGKLIVIDSKDTKEQKEATISGGVIEISNGIATILTTSAEWVEEIDIKRAEAAKRRAEERLKENLSHHEEKIQEAALRRAVNRINTRL